MRLAVLLCSLVVVGLHTCGWASVVTLGEDETPSSPSEAKAAELTAQANLQEMTSEIGQQSKAVAEQMAAVEKLKAESKTLTNKQMSANMKMHNTETLTQEAELAVQAGERSITRTEDKITALKSKLTDAEEAVKQTKNVLADAEGKLQAAKVIQDGLPKNSAETFEFTSEKVKSAQALQNKESAEHHRNELNTQIKQQEKNLEEHKKAAKKAKDEHAKLTTELTAAKATHDQAFKKANKMAAGVEVEVAKLAASKKKLHGLTEAKGGLQTASQQAKQGAYEADAASKTNVLAATAKDEAKEAAAPASSE